VNQDEVPIFRPLHIHLDQVASQRNGLGDRAQRILRRVPAGAAVADAERFFLGGSFFCHAASLP